MEPSQWTRTEIQNLHTRLEAAEKMVAEALARQADGYTAILKEISTRITELSADVWELRNKASLPNSTTPQRGDFSTPWTPKPPPNTQNPGKQREMKNRTPTLPPCQTKSSGK